MADSPAVSQQQKEQPLCTGLPFVCRFPRAWYWRLRTIRCHSPPLLAFCSTHSECQFFGCHGCFEEEPRVPAAACLGVQGSQSSRTPFLSQFHFSKCFFWETDKFGIPKFGICKPLNLGIGQVSKYPHTFVTQTSSSHGRPFPLSAARPGLAQDVFQGLLTHSIFGLTGRPATPSGAALHAAGHAAGLPARPCGGQQLEGFSILQRALGPGFCFKRSLWHPVRANEKKTNNDGTNDMKADTTWVF